MIKIIKPCIEIKSGLEMYAREIYGTDTLFEERNVPLFWPIKMNMAKATAISKWVLLGSTFTFLFSI